MAKALALCCLVLGLSFVAWAQEPLPPAPAPAPAPEQPAPAPAPTPAPTPEQPAPTPAAAPTPEQPAPTPELPAPAPAPTPAPAPAPPPEQPAPTPAPAPPPPAPSITAIVVRGNQHIPTDDIMKAITAKVGEPFTAALAQEQAQKVRALGWFYDVDLTSEPTAQGVQMNVTVVENPVIKGIVIEGNTVYTADQLKAVMQTRPGQVANNDIIRSDLMALQNKYANAGYIFMRITDITTDAKTGNLVITLVEGQVEEVRITGNRKTKRYVVLREMRTRPGGILNADRLRRDLDRLVNLEIFEDVSAQPTVGTAPGKVIVNINVKERKTGLASAGVAYSSVQKFVGFVDYAEANLRGTGQKVSARAEFGGRQSYELGYFAPWIAAPATSMQLNVYARRILREAFTTTNQAFLYDEKRTGGNVTFSRPLGASETTRVYGTLRVDSVSVLQEENQAPLPAIIALQRGEQVRSIGFTVRNDTRNIIANPTHGGVNAFSMEFAGLLLGGANFTKFGLDVRRYFHATGGKRIFAMRFLAGTTTGDPPFLEQYLIGGGETLRGFRNDRFPGEHMLLLNNELRIPLQQSFALVVFADVGDAWGGIFARDLGDTTFKPHLGYGLGVRVVTPIGPIRIDYGISNEGQETHFSVGHAF